MHSKTLLLRLAGICLAGAMTSPASADDRPEATLIADCRIEGEAGGLSGAALDEFIEQCVAELLSLEMRNLQKD